MDNIKVSIIVPCYNVAPYLPRCLDSLVGQTLKDIEIICVNDCSTDQTESILAEYVDRDPRIKNIKNPQNLGEGATRNAGLNQAKGEYVGFVDSDDAVDLDFYEKLYDLATRENLDIAKGNMVEIDYKGNRKVTNKNNLDSSNPLYIGSEFSTLIYRRSFLQKNNFLFPCGVPVGADILFLNHVVLATDKVAYVNDVHYQYYQREDSMNSVTLSDEKVYSGLKVFKTIMENINASSKALEDKKAYVEATYNVLFNCMNMTFKAAPVLKKECADVWMFLYNQIQFKDLINAKLSGQFSKVLEFLQRQDVDGLFQYILPYKSWLEFLFATLKHKLRRK